MKDGIDLTRRELLAIAVASPFSAIVQRGPAPRLDLKTLAASPSRGVRTITDYWTGENLGRREGVLTAEMPPQSARLLACR